MIVRPVLKTEESQYKRRMQEYHYLGFAPKIGETLWYIATHDDQWVALPGFSVSAFLDERYRTGAEKMTITTGQMRSLPDFLNPYLTQDVPRRRDTGSPQF